MADPAASISIERLKTCDEWLRRLPEEVAESILGEALADGGDVIRRGAMRNIHSRTGRTAADLHVEVQVNKADIAGAAAVGGTKRGQSARNRILTWLERGTKPHKIIAGRRDRAQFKRAFRALGRLDPRAAATFAQKATIKRALALPSGPRASVKHPGISAQAPLTRALTEQGPAAAAAFRDRLWSGILAASMRLWGQG